MLEPLTAKVGVESKKLAHRVAHCLGGTSPTIEATPSSMSRGGKDWRFLAY